MNFKINTMKIEKFIELTQEAAPILINIDNISHIQADKEQTIIMMNHQRKDGYPWTIIVSENYENIKKMLK